MSSFLSSLSSQISSQFSLGENTNHSLDTVDPETGKQEKYGSLGDFAQHFDQSATRSYVEEGYLRRDPYNTTPKQFEILLQEPAATVLVKKRMFTSVAENFRPDFMDSDEKLYFRAMRILFKNKCEQIAAMEKLSKIEKISAAVGKFDAQLMPIVFSLIDSLTKSLSTNGASPGSSLDFSVFGVNLPFLKTDFGNLVKVIDRIRAVYSFNTPNNVTTWITDPNGLYKSSIGTGTGVIEITNFTSLTTNVGTNLAGGSCTLNITDPYELMLITEWDIEKAISDATNEYYKHASFQFGQISNEQVIQNNTARFNQLRAARKASPITFKVTPDTLLGQRVIAIIDRIGTELVFEYKALLNKVVVSDEYLKNGAVAGFDGLDTSKVKTFGPDNNLRSAFPDTELSVFSTIIGAIFSKIQLEKNSRNAIIVNNDLTNYARRKLRFNFAGKLIIQPQDVIHIYASSKTKSDNKILSGLNNMFSGNGILQNLNKTFTDFKSSFDLAFNPNTINTQMEKAVYVGEDFPNFLWAIMRNQFVNEKEGAHIFAGIIESASSSWAAEGKFTVSIAGKDNAAYLDKGKINFKPGVDTFNGAIWDPLTPFKSNFNSVTANFSDDLPVLLDENQYLLSPSGKDTKSSIVKLKYGPYAGNHATSNNVVHDQSVDPINGNLTRTYYAPDGLVYKWKEGIGVFVQYGSSLSLNDPTKVGNPNTFQQPFAGQDIMNVLSLAITGQPYNFANYWKAAVELHGVSSDSQSQQNPAHSYITSLRNDLTKTNLLWGNFIPFKNLTINEQAYVQALNNTFQITTANQKIEKNLKEIEDLNRQAELKDVENLLSEKVGVSSNPDLTVINDKKKKLFSDVDAQITDIANKSKSANYLSDIGNDVSFDFDRFSDSGNASKSMTDPSIRRDLRRKLNLLTRRMSYDVRANQDKNLFIVDDFYDKDFDILAYDKAIAGGIELYGSDPFNSTKTIVENTAKLLNLEVFADTQGHIRVRPPQYNRMPSSVFYRMMYMKQTLGIQVFPEFLNDIFNSQLKILRQQVEILEDMIRLDCAVLSNNDDSSAMKFISTSGSSDNNADDAFTFISDEDGNISDIPTLLNAANPETHNDQDQSLQKINAQNSSTKAIFTNSQRFNVIKQYLQDASGDGASYGAIKTYKDNTYIDRLISRIKTKSGMNIPRTFFTYTPGNSYTSATTYTNIDYFKVTSDLAEKIQERQKVIKLFYGALKNANEFKSLDNSNTNGQVANKLMAPGLFGNKNIPEVFEHMIEDESYDDYGIGSGSRYIIKRSQITGMQIHENVPEYNMVEVHGYINDFASQSENQGVGGLTVPNFGNGLTTAIAVDYDSWRNYGLLTPFPVTVPFLKDPVTQCAPFATMLLSQARKNIFRGSIDIVGNEYMQPGEVIFLEDRGMLFYVNRVSHTFQYSQSGGSFKTHLEVSYGHTPGEYIPTTLDIFGKMIYKNRDIASYTVQRQSGASNDISVGALIMPGGSVPSSTAIPGHDNSPPNPTSVFNDQVVNNILFTAANVINANNTQGNNVLAKLELRVYYDDTMSTPDKDLFEFAQDIQKSFLSDTMPKQSKAPPSLGSTKDGYVVVAPVNMTPSSERRSPSQKAFDLAREQVKIINTSGGGASQPTNTSDGGAPLNSQILSSNFGKTGNVNNEHDKVRLGLFKYVIDCWVVFENKGMLPDKQSATPTASDTTKMSDEDKILTGNFGSDTSNETSNTTEPTPAAMSNEDKILTGNFG
jgi:hypothetical protein